MRQHVWICERFVANARHRNQPPHPARPLSPLLTLITLTVISSVFVLAISVGKVSNCQLLAEVVKGSRARLSSALAPLFSPAQAAE